MAERSSSVAGATRPAPSGGGGARSTGAHSLGSGSAGLEGVAQLVSRHKLAASAALGIHMDGPFNDGFDALGGQAGRGDLVDAAGGRAFGVVTGLNPPDLGGLGRSLEGGVLCTEPVDAPGLDGGGRKRDPEPAHEDAGDHAASS